MLFGNLCPKSQILSDQCLLAPFYLRFQAQCLGNKRSQNRKELHVLDQRDPIAEKAVDHNRSHYLITEDNGGTEQADLFLLDGMKSFAVEKQGPWTTLQNNKGLGNAENQVEPRFIKTSNPFFRVTARIILGRGKEKTDFGTAAADDDGRRRLGNSLRKDPEQTLNRLLRVERPIDYPVDQRKDT
jgi:hypothetical protein